MVVFIVGGLVVAVAVIAWILYHGAIGLPGSNPTNVKIVVPGVGATEAPKN